MNATRWHIELIEEPDNLPIRWQPPIRETPLRPPGEQAGRALLGAFELLAHRGPGVGGWTVPFRHDPIAFLLDTVSDAVSVWNARGALLYQNRAASEIGVGRGEEAPLEAFTLRGRHFERRSLRCHSGDAEYILEIIHEVP